MTAHPTLVTFEVEHLASTIYRLNTALILVHRIRRSPNHKPTFDNGHCNVILLYALIRESPCERLSDLNTHAFIHPCTPIHEYLLYRQLIDRDQYVDQ